MNYSDNYNKAYELLKRWENKRTKNGLIVYSNIKEDTGGETVLGVARNLHYNLSIWQEVDKIKQELFGDKKYYDKEETLLLSKKILENEEIVETVKYFFYNNFWLKTKCNIINCYEFAANIFLLSVNAGIRRGIRTGQQACNIQADGIIGKNTINAWKNANLGNAKKFTEIEIQYYTRLVKQKPQYKIFKDGWINRANAI